MTKKIFIYMFCLIMVIIVNLKIYSFYQGYVESEKEFSLIVERKASAIRSGELVLSASEQAKLIINSSNRELGIHVTRFLAYLAMFLFAILIFAVPITKQLTSQSNGHKKC